MESEIDPLALTLVLSAAAGSLLALWLLFVKHIGGRPLLSWQPRRPVPWNALAPAVILAPTAAMLVTTALGGNQAPGEAVDAAYAALNAPLPATNVIERCVQLVQSAALAAAREADAMPTARDVWQLAALTLLIAVACCGMLSAAYGATREDLGLPANLGRLAADVGIGAWGFLAVLLPLYVVQIVLATTMEVVEPHPLMQQMLDSPSPSMIWAGAIAAIVAAPLFEETAFRLVLQGWLERVVARRELAASFGEGPAPAAELVRWGPIAVSAGLFGLAHWGQGVAPISLTLLGVVLGYIYQRTHRIVPCIACHMLFNALSMSVFLLQTT